MQGQGKLLDRSGGNDTFFLTLIATIFVYFGLRLVFYAVNIPHSIPPDELTHFGMSRVFAGTWGLPSNSAGTYHLGSVTHIPWVYYYLMGRFLPLNVLPISDLVYLRFLNIILSLLTIVFSFRWIGLVTENKLTRVFFLLLVTNIPMLTFLGAAVNYDNLVILCAVMTLYYTHRFFAGREPACFFAAGIAMLVGCLSKISFLPLVPLFLGILLFHERKRLGEAAAFLRHIPRNLGGPEKVLSLVFAVLLIMCFHLYGTNLIRFHRLVPAAHQVLSEEQFMQNRITARDHVITKYRSGEWSYDRAVAETEKIRHPGDKATALQILQLQEMNTKKDVPVMGRLAYSFNWLNNFLVNSVGLCAHRAMLKNINEVAVYRSILLLAFIFLARYWNLEEAGFMINQSMVIVCGYGLYLMQFHNYPLYLWSMSPTLGNQGRYIFPVLVPLLGVMAFYLTNFLRQRAALLLVILVSVFFVWGDFPYFLSHADGFWLHDRENAVSRHQWGDSYRKTGDLQRAIVEYQAAVSLDPDNAWYHRFLGDLYSEKGLPQQALEEYEAAVRLEPEVAGFHYLAGKILQDMGEVEKAAEMYRNAVRLDPDNAWYRRFLEDLNRSAGMPAQGPRQDGEALPSAPGNKERAQ